jgi:hypothetical protein
MKQPFYASQLADITELVLSLGIDPIVAEGIAQKLAESNGILSDEAFDFEDSDEENGETLP